MQRTHEVERQHVRRRAGFTIWIIAGTICVAVLMPIFHFVATFYYLRSLNHGDMKHVAYAISKLRSESHMIRAAAAKGLGSIGPDADDAVADLLIALDDESCQVASSAAWALGNIQSRQRGRETPIHTSVVAALVKSLDHADGEVRRYAAYALYFVGPSGRSAVPPLIEKLNDDHMAYMAARALGEMGPAARRAIPKLTILLSSPHPGERAESARALAKLGPLPPETVRALQRLGADEVDFVRRAANKAMNALSSQNSPESLVE